MATQVTIRGNADTLLQSAKALGKRSVKPGVRAFVIPQDNEQYGEAIDNGAIPTLHKAGFKICAPNTPDPAVTEEETAIAHPGAELADVLAAAV